MQGFGRPHYTNVAMPFATGRPGSQTRIPPASTGVASGAARLAEAACRARLRRRGGCALRCPERGPVGISKDARTPADSTSRSSSATTARTSSSRPSSSGRTRASSRIRINGGTRGSRVGSTSAGRWCNHRLCSRATPKDGLLRVEALPGEIVARLDPRGRRARIPAAWVRIVALAAALVGRGPRALHARRHARTRERRLPRRLPHRRGPGPAPAPQRQGGAHPRRQPPRPRRPPRQGRDPRADGAGRCG